MSRAEPLHSHFSPSRRSENAFSLREGVVFSALSHTSGWHMAEEVRFQHFEVLRKDDGSLFELGRGAMGITYKAFDTNLRCHRGLEGHQCRLSEQRGGPPAVSARGACGGGAAASECCDGVPSGERGRQLFLRHGVCRWRDGRRVHEARGRRADPDGAGDRLAGEPRPGIAAQKQGLVHRDIKPSNLMLVREDDDFTVKVIDFGLAKSAATEATTTASLTAGGFLGTPHFASPEQLDEREIDVRSDIYSLGVTLWYMLAGRTPFSGSLAQVMSQHLHREPPFESLDGTGSGSHRPAAAHDGEGPGGAPTDAGRAPPRDRGLRYRRGVRHAILAAPGGRRAMRSKRPFCPSRSTDQPEAVSGAIFAGQYRLINEVDGFGSRADVPGRAHRG